MRNLPEYRNFLYFFEREVQAKGWQAVVHEYCFSHTPLAETMLAQLFEGAYHPIIHLGFGIEFAAILVRSQPTQVPVAPAAAAPAAPVVATPVAPAAPVVPPAPAKPTYKRP